MIVNSNIAKGIILMFVLTTVMQIGYFLLKSKKITQRRVRYKVNSNCTEISAEELVDYGKDHRFVNGIPRIIHYNYKDESVPSQYVPLVQGCVSLYPSVKFVFWTDASSLKFVQEHYPQRLNIYSTYLNKTSAPLKKSDIIRYFILHYFGGIYMDLDTRCQRPLEGEMNRSSCVLSKEPEIQTQIRWNRQFYAMNSFMACVPNHDFFKYLLDSVTKDDNSEIVAKTGPQFLTDVFIKYNAEISKSNRTNDQNVTRHVTLASSDTYSPLVDGGIAGYCARNNRCNDYNEYKKTEKDRIAKAVLVHLFYHLGYTFAYGYIKNRVDVCTIQNIEFIQ